MSTEDEWAQHEAAFDWNKLYAKKKPAEKKPVKKKPTPAPRQSRERQEAEHQRKMTEERRKGREKQRLIREKKEEAAKFAPTGELWSEFGLGPGGEEIAEDEPITWRTHYPKEKKEPTRQTSYIPWGTDDEDEPDETTTEEDEPDESPEEEGDYEEWSFEGVDDYLIDTDDLQKKRQRLWVASGSGAFEFVGHKVGDRIEWDNEREKRRHELAKTGQDLEDVEDSEKAEREDAQRAELDLFVRSYAEQRGQQAEDALADYEGAALIAQKTIRGMRVRKEYLARPEVRPPGEEVPQVSEMDAWRATEEAHHEWFKKEAAKGKVIRKEKVEREAKSMSKWEKERHYARAEKDEGFVMGAEHGKARERAEKVAWAKEQEDKEYRKRAAEKKAAGQIKTGEYSPIRDEPSPEVKVFRRKKKPRRKRKGLAEAMR